MPEEDTCLQRDVPPDSSKILTPSRFLCLWFWLSIVAYLIAAVGGLTVVIFAGGAVPNFEASVSSIWRVSASSLASVILPSPIVTLPWMLALLTLGLLIFHTVLRRERVVSISRAVWMMTYGTPLLAAASLWIWHGWRPFGLFQPGIGG